MFVDDQTGTLSQGDIARLQAIASPLDVKVRLAATETRGELDVDVGQMVTSANTLAIGVDPVHRYTFTHFGTGTGISRGDFQAIARAGNGEFHQGHWAEGINAIVASASAASSREAAATGVVVQPTTVVEHEAPVWPFILGGGLFVLMFAVFVHWFRRRASKLDAAVDGLNQEANEHRARNVEEQAWHDEFAAKHAPAKLSRPPSRGVRSVPSSPAYAPAAQAVPSIVNNQPGNSNDLLTGVLIGESMARAEPAPVIVETPRSIDSGYSSGSDSSSFSTPSSFDSGGFSGGFGGGGGGFDGGGGGGSF